MKSRRASLWLCGLLVAGLPQCLAASAKPEAQVRRIILRSQHLGAHGMGYNTSSLEELSRKLEPEDDPTLIGILKQKDLTVGAEFALAAQCEAAIDPLHVAALQSDDLLFLMATEDTLRLIAEFEGCPSGAKQHAASTREELADARDQMMQRERREVELREANDARIQRNAMKMMDPAQAGQLTRTEREEVFQRSLKASGLDKQPRTPAQEQLVQRMYRTMVLGEAVHGSAPQ